MLSASFFAAFSFGSFIILLILLFRFFIFKKLTVTYGKFKGSRAVYRVVKGDLQTLQKEQLIFTRRAQSLWGKEMRSWPTFRIIFPNFYNKYSIFGIIVPDSFNCDNECLEELGFRFGSLDSIQFAAKIEIPTRFCYSLKLNQYRAFKTIKLLFKNKNLRKNVDHDKVRNKNNNHENNLNQMDDSNNKDDSKDMNIKNIINKNFIEQNLISNTKTDDDLIDNEIKNNSDKTNNQNIDNIDDQIYLSNDDISSIQNKDDENNDLKIKSSEHSNESNDETKIEMLSPDEKNQMESSEEFEARIEALTDDPPFAEIRYKKKKKQIFIAPLMNYNELVGLWKPTY